jgi:DNA-binding NtrC family response regulator
MKTKIGPDYLRGDGKRILVVDSEPTILEMLLELFSCYGFTVFLAPNAEKALALFKQRKGNFDFVFADIALSGMNGLELAKRITLKKPGLPILLASGGLPESSQLQTISERGYPFIRKPYRFGPLLQTIKELKTT